MMFINYNLSSFLLIVSFPIFKSDYININWNISTDRGNSDFERKYKYPMYQEVAPVPCDLTDSCDVFCRQDTDCDESQKLSFARSEPVKNCNGLLSFFDCDCDKFDKPEWLSVFCYVHINPVYLGKFFKTLSKIEKFSTFRTHITNVRRFVHQNHEKEVRTKVLNKHGSPLMTFIPVSNSFPSVSPLMIRTALKDSSFACKSIPVSYRINQSSNCFTKLSEELCQSGHLLSVFPYLLQDKNQSSNNMPVVLKDLDILKGIETEVVVKCLKLIRINKKFKKQEENYYHWDGIRPCTNSITTHTVLVNNTCRNVLVYVHQEFTLNGSDIVKLKVEYGLGDVPLSVDYNYKYKFINQKFSVSFFDIMIKSSVKRNYSQYDEVLNRGYFVGEELNFGFKSERNNTTIWTKGILGVFKNGDSCDVSPATFGFNHFSICHVRENFSTCSQLRKRAQEKLDSLLQGDSLAVYQNLRPPYNDSLPVLRNFKNVDNRSECEIPTVQNVLIQYTTIRTTNGRLVHRILGVRIDRSFLNFKAPGNLSLISRVSFLTVSSSHEEETSRFWKRMYSPEQSENSWLHFFNSFDDVTTDEREEIIFWSILLFALISTFGIFTKFDFSFDELT